MKKTVVISSNENDNYLFFVPIVAWAWKKLGWETLILFTGKGNNSKFSLVNRYVNQPILFHLPIDGVRNETLTQVVRLYAHTYCDGYIMTSDVDMLPLSDYWKFNEEEITAWGRDLSDKHFPICYIGASAKNWEKLMDGKTILEDLQKHPNYKSAEWTEWWQVDQDIITSKLNKQSVVRIDRGIDNPTHYPLGRIDRGNWEKTLQQKERIDSHLLRPGYTTDNWENILDLIKECLNPTTEDIDWLVRYRNEYIAL